MTAESVDKDHTDSENEMQEEIVGEEVIEQNLDEVILYSNTFEGRPVRRKPQALARKEVGSSPKAIVLHSPKNPQLQRAGVIPKQSVRVTPSSRLMPMAKPVKVGGGTLVSPQGVTLKRKLENSPLVVKLDNIKKPALGTPLGRTLSTTPKPQPKVRYVKHTEAQTEMTGEIFDQYQQIIEEDQQKIQLLEDQVRKLKYTPEMFENDDKRTQYFTGLESFVNMVTLYNNCEPDLPASSTLTKFEIFILTLLKLRLKLPMALIGYMFGVSPKTAVFFFNECITVLHSVMREIFVDTIETVEAK